jgi:hypothetical protein
VAGLGRCPWRAGAWLLLVLALAQACGGGGGGGTGPTGRTDITISLRGPGLAELPQNCTGILTVTGAGLVPVTVTIPPSGQVSLALTAGRRTFSVTLTCAKTTGPQTFTGQQEADVVIGQPLSLSIPITVNEPPRASASCSPSSVPAGTSSSCRCTVTDPDPGDRLTVSWNATGGSVSPATGTSTSFVSTESGSFGVSCAVSDGRVTTSATTDVTVTPVSGPAPVNPTLTITVSGSGTVTSVPAGISCPTACAASAPAGTVVTLTAAPAAGSVFDGWSGAGCSGTGPCVVTLQAPAAVAATFSPAPPGRVSLTVTVAGSGTVISTPAGISCPTACAAPFPIGTVVSLAAMPAAGAAFTGWSGAGCSGTGPCRVTLAAATTVTATFTAQSFTLTVAKIGSGTGTVTGGGINCGATCSVTVPFGTQVTLTAAAAPASAFAGWSGGGCGGTAGCTVTVTAALTVTARFELLGSLSIVNLFDGPLTGVIITGPTPLGPVTVGGGATMTFANQLAPGAYTAQSGVYYPGAAACPAVPFTIAPGGSATVTYNLMFNSPQDTCLAS